MSVRLSDLPKHVRDRVEAEAKLPKRSGNGSKKGGGSTAHRGSCHACGERFDTGAAWVRHSDETGHRRFVCDIDPVRGREVK